MRNLSNWHNHENSYCQSGATVRKILQVCSYEDWSVEELILSER
jgi:hypothetical protein